MSKSTTCKRCIAVFMTLVIVLSFSLSVSAAGDRRTFQVRMSNTYASKGTITIQSDYGSVNSAKSGFIYFNCESRKVDQLL